LAILLTRVDDRLIHGQVTEGWFKKNQPDVVIVISDEVATEDWEKELCLAALPEKYKGIVVNIDESVKYINDSANNVSKSYLLFESPKDVFRAIEKGAVISEVNIGGMHSSKGKKEIINYIHVDDEDVKYLKLLKEKNIKLDFRDLPNSENCDVMSRL